MAGNDDIALFVSSDDSFEVSVYYAADSETGIFYAVREDQATEKEKEKMNSIKFTCRFPDWGMCRTIVAESTVNIGGRIIVDPGQMQVAIVSHLVTGWDIKVDGEKDLPFSIEKLIKLRPDIVRCLFELVSIRLVEAGVWESLVTI